MRRTVLRTNLLRELIQKAFSGSGKELVLAALDGHVTAGNARKSALLRETADD